MLKRTMQELGGTFREDSLSNSWTWGDVPPTRLNQELDWMDVLMGENCGVYPDEQVREPACDLFGDQIGEGELLFDEAMTLDGVMCLEEEVTWEDVVDERFQNERGAADEWERFCDESRWADFGVLREAEEKDVPEPEEVDPGSLKREETRRLLEICFKDNGFCKKMQRDTVNKRNRGQQPRYKDRRKGRLPTSFVAFQLSSNGNGREIEDDPEALEIRPTHRFREAVCSQ